ncbi:MAG: hypothetical protein BJ554DRAFT_4605 [Olpidium bornovanus]|uniref:Uncharacterized protein n=1 Tax=Olpidium bornovanus TaxID=278681 RepID=A0A8H7ZZU8_9FUNG|nr:MAG: hypothetical protein BJ554DRAFT_4605 [Olpidium bornovanus]
MADQPDPNPHSASTSSRARSSPRPPEHANTFDPVAIKSPFPPSRDAGEAGSRRRGPSFLGAAASPATLRLDAERRSLENLGVRGAAEQTGSASSTETAVEQHRQAYTGGESGGRPRGPRAFASDRADSPSRLRSGPTKEGGGSTIGGEQALEEGMGGGGDTAATFGSAAALVLVACSAIRFGLRQAALAGNQSWVPNVARPRLLRRRSNTVAAREEGGDLVRQADAFDDSLLWYPLLVTVLVIAVLIANIVCI